MLSVASSRSRLVLVGLLSMLALTATPVAAVDPAATAPPPTLQPTPTVDGVDVSHHQEVISWGRVRQDGKRFAFIKATEGERYIDPLYAYNHSLATNAGLRSGAFHFAQPSATPGSAIRQADHFLAWFDLHDGDLLPVLDLERTNGLDPVELTGWTLTWLNRVRTRTGLAAVVYVSPLFWRNQLSDTTAIADAGYPLWIAHWGVASPLTPAADWGDRSWTIWQYDDCGRVPGIIGCALLDHVAGSLEPLVYRGPGFKLTGDHFAPFVARPEPGAYPDESERGPRRPTIFNLVRPADRS